MLNQERINNHFTVFLFFVSIFIVIGMSIPGDALAQCSKWDVDCQERIRQQIIREQQQRQSSGGRQTQEKWYVICNRTGTNYQNQNAGRIELGKQMPFNNNYLRMQGPFNSEPSARYWVNNNCSSWQCDWNGACVSSGMESPQAASSIAGTFAIYQKGNEARGPVGYMRISEQHGDNFSIGCASPSGQPTNDWQGTGTIQGTAGYYSWRFNDGRTGRTNFTVDNAGNLYGQVRGSGISWDYIARKTSRSSDCPPGMIPGTKLGTLGQEERCVPAGLR